MTSVTITTLDDLLDVCRRAPRGAEYDSDPDEYASVIAGYAETVGLPLAHGDIDWTSLPVFGGEPPRNCSGVWSWDADRLLVGDSLDNWRLVDRAEYDRA